MKSSFKVLLIVFLTVISVLLSLIVYNLFFKNSNIFGNLFSQNITLICELKYLESMKTPNYVSNSDNRQQHGYTTRERVAALLSKNAPSDFENFKKFIKSRKMKILFISNEKLKIQYFKSKEEANSFKIELNNYFGSYIKELYIH